MPNAVDTAATTDPSVERTSSHPADLLAAAGPAGGTPTGQTAVADEGVAEETIVEEISIDGMCGVY
jgi:mycofactocin precursor